MLIMLKLLVSNDFVRAHVRAVITRILTRLVVGSEPAGQTVASP